MKQQQIIDLFENLPSKDTNLYTVALKDIVQQNNLIEDETNLITIIEKSSVFDSRFAAFYALLIAYREFESLSKYIELVDKYGELFSEVKLYNVVLSTYYRNKVLIGDKTAGRESIIYAKKACDDYDDNYAVKHHYSETVAYMAESNVEVNDDDISTAIDYVNDVISKVPNHSTYYCTKGRLLALKEDYVKAEYYLHRAADYEKADTKDAVIRVGKFNHYLLMIQMKKNEKALKSQYNEFTKKIEKDELLIQDLIKTVNELQTKYLEYLAFFSAILALIMVSVNVVVKVTDYFSAIGLIITLAGVLIVSFMIFAMLLPSVKNEDSKIKFLICLVIAMLLFATGCYLASLQQVP